MNPKKIFTGIAVIMMFGTGGCALPNTKAASGIAFPGRWEEVRRIEFGNIPAEQLSGDLGPAYLLYLVTVAAFHTEKYGLTAGPDDDVRYTVDGGVTWTRASGELHCRHGLEIVDDRVAWHCGNGGTRLSLDGGRTWTTVAPSACPSLSFLDSKAGWAASPYQLQATTDGGATWNTLEPPLEEEKIAAVALVNRRVGYLLDEAGALYGTKDGGERWEAFSIGLNDGDRLVPSYNGPRAVIRFLDVRNGIAVYDLLDRSVWFAVTADGGRTWRRAEISSLRDQSYYFQLYLSRDGQWLTVTDDFNNGKNVSIVFHYEPG
jgi:photosystem II stability/assembly factor-like uncharacterized protein